MSTPLLDKILVNKDDCYVYVPRKGAFAALGRCAKCNRRESEHIGANENAPTPKGKVLQRAVSAEGLRVISSKLSQPTLSFASENPTFNIQKETREEQTQTLTVQADPTVTMQSTHSAIENPCEKNEQENQHHKKGPNSPSVLEQEQKLDDPLPVSQSNGKLKAVSTSVESKMDEHSVRFDMSVTEYCRSLQMEEKTAEEHGLNVPLATEISFEDENDEIHNDSPENDQNTEDEEEEVVERPSNAPPPLIIVSQSPTKKRLSWLSKPRSNSESSAGSTGSNSPGKRASLRLLASQLRSKVSKAKETWEAKIGDALPNCNRCGRPIEPHHKLVSAGMQRFHEICPSKAESEKGLRNTRYMVQKSMDRIVLTFRCDGETRQPYSFIFDLDQETKQKSLRQRNNEDMTLLYIYDEKQHASKQRRFKPPNKREFDIEVRYMPVLSFEDPKSTIKHEPKLEGSDLTLTKFFQTNGVVQTVVAHFVYDEENRYLSPVHLEVRFSMLSGNKRLPTIFRANNVASTVPLKNTVPV